MAEIQDFLAIAVEKLKVKADKLVKLCADKAEWNKSSEEMKAAIKDVADKIDLCFKTKDVLRELSE